MNFSTLSYEQLTSRNIKKLSNILQKSIINNLADIKQAGFQD